MNSFTVSKFITENRQEVDLTSHKIQDLIRCFGERIFKGFHKFLASEIAFETIDKAKTFVKDLGYTYGSMACDSPIAVAKGFDYIAKWYKIEPYDYHKIQGVLLSNNFRDNAEVYFFEFE